MADKATIEQALPNVDDITSSPDFDDSASDAYQFDFEEKFQSDLVRSEVEWAKLKGLQDHYRHKGNWSWFLMGLLIAMIGFQSVLMIFVGLNIWDFKEYEWLLPALLVQNLGQVIALAYVVVKSLFR